MTEQQVERWREIAKAMCLHAWHITPARKKRLWSEASLFINNCVRFHDIEEIEGWEDLPFWADNEDYARTIEGSDDSLRDNPRYFVRQLSTVIRTSINLAIGTGPGVFGFTVGDIRQWFDGEIPGWVTEQYKNELPDMPDDTGIWI